MSDNLNRAIARHVERLAASRSMLERERLQGKIEGLKLGRACFPEKRQYGVKIAFENEETEIMSFNSLERADHFASLYDPVTAPAHHVLRIERFTRTAVEVYSEWEPQT
jgi:hypothetical protein